MKKIFVFASFLFTALAANAQDNFNPWTDRQFLFDVLNICGIMAVIYLISTFILQLTRFSLDHKLKNRMLDKGTTESLASELLKAPAKKDAPNLALQWCCVLGGVGLGFVLMRLFLPYGLHSLALMAFCVALGFGVYYLIVKGVRL